MPRFGTEQIPSALKEMMWRQELNNLMFNPTPLAQQGGGLAGLANRMTKRTNPGPYDPVYGMEQYDDTKTGGQSAREDRELSEGMRASKMQRVRPEQYNDPGSTSSFLRELPPASALGMPPGSPMQEAYERMPYQGAPRYPMMEMPQGSAEMNQLLQFYSDENI